MFTPEYSLLAFIILFSVFNPRGSTVRFGGRVKIYNIPEGMQAIINTLKIL